MEPGISGGARTAQEPPSSPATPGLVAALVVLLLVAPLLWQWDRWYRQQQEQDVREQVKAQLVGHGHSITESIGRRLALLAALKALVEAHDYRDIEPRRLDVFAASLHGSATGIRALQLVRDGVIRYAYPLAGNEAALGYDLTRHPNPKVRADLQRAIDTGELVITSPLDLVQGGKGLVARIPLFQGDQPWGLVAMVLDLPAVLEEAGLGDGNGELHFALREFQGDMVQGDAAVFQGDAVTDQIVLADGVWELAALPAQGWDAYGRDTLRLLRAAGAAIALLLAGLAYLLASRQTHLAQLVEARTRELSATNAQLQGEIQERQRALGALKRSELRYRTLYDDNPSMYFTLDEDGVILSVNRHGAEQLGYRPEELVGRRVAELTPDERQQQMEAHISACPALPNQVFRWEGRLRRRQGSILWVRHTARTVGAEEGRQAIYMVCEDVTERRQAERALRESEERFRSAFGDAAIGMALVNPDHSILQVNRAFCDMLGYDADELVGRHFRDLTHPDDVAASARAHEDLFTGAVPCYELEKRYRHRDGREVWAWLSVSQVRDASGRPQYAIAQIQDITQRKLAETALREHQEQLEALVTRRTAELTAANEELQALAYSLSHDLRAPLRAIDGFSLALLEDWGPRLDERGRDHLERVRRATQRLGRLIDDMLGLASVTRQELRAETVDLSHLAHDILDELAAGDRGRSVERDIEPGCVAWGDPQLLRVLLENLLGNAWKFTAAAEAARIGLRRVPSPRGMAFVVEDNGAGFDMGYAERLFRPFQRLHGMDEFEGTGIGLASVRRIAHRHHGEVWAEGSVGGGARFYFRLPEQPPLAERSRPGGQAQASAS